MAKRRNLASSSHHFFMIVVLSVSALGIMLFTYASQQKTQTKSDASGCLNKPYIKFISGDSIKNSAETKYKLKLYNYCPNPKRFNVKVIKTPTEPTRYDNWSWSLKEKSSSGEASLEIFQGTYLTDAIGNKPTDIELVASRPKWNMNKGDYKYFVLRASLEKNANIYDDIYLIYTVE